MIDSKQLPPGLRNAPEIITARLDNHRERLDQHELRITQLEHQPMGTVDTPMGKLPLPIALLILFGLLAWRPDLASGLASKLIGQ